MIPFCHACHGAAKREATAASQRVEKQKAKEKLGLELKTEVKIIGEI